jgi:hypothetical protein
MSKPRANSDTAGLSPEALEIVKQYLDDFKAAKTKEERTAIIRRASLQVTEDDEDRPLIHAEVRKVCTEHPHHLGRSVPDSLFRNRWWKTG